MLNSFPSTVIVEHNGADDSCCGTTGYKVYRECAHEALPIQEGVASAPALFKQSLLQGIPSVCVYIDDILVTGKDDEEHLCNLEEVLRHLEVAGLKLKCETNVFSFYLKWSTLCI